ncbi:MAG: signal peptidase II [Ignavibacteriales bacterium]|nr:MAG: signal peptidase II [Ignavibacteriales bacterium]
MKILRFTFLIILIDQITKFFIKGFSLPVLNIHNPGLNYGEKHEILGSFLRITFVENPGMAFGINLGISSKLFLSLFSIVASIGILLYMYKVRNEGFMFRFSLALILAGAVGNLIDRVFYGVIYGYAPLFQGKVVDFIDIDFFDMNLFGAIYDRWPIFNVADMAVSIGVILLIFFSTKEKAAEAQITNDTNESVLSESNHTTTISEEENKKEDNPDVSPETTGDRTKGNPDEPGYSQEI